MSLPPCFDSNDRAVFRFMKQILRQFTAYLLSFGFLLPTLVLADEIRLENGMLLRGESKLLRGIDNQAARPLQADDPVDLNQNDAGGWSYNPIVEINDDIRKYFISDDMVAADGIKASRAHLAMSESLSICSLVLRVVLVYQSFE